MTEREALRALCDIVKRTTFRTTVDREGATEALGVLTNRLGKRLAERARREASRPKRVRDRGQTSADYQRGRRHGKKGEAPEREGSRAYQSGHRRGVLDSQS